MDRLSLTFVVCTRNGEARIAATLQAIAVAAGRVSDTPCDLVVVDNDSQDRTAPTVRAWAATAPLPVKVLHEQRPGLAAARNAALAAAGGTVLAFTDDDCRLDPGYATCLLRHYRQDNRPVIRGGRIELGDPRDLPFTIKTDHEARTYDGETHPSGFIHGCNMTMHRAVVERIGLFDLDFGAGGRFRSGEDTEYIYRAHRAGLPVIYVPDCVVYHHHGRRRLEDVRRLARLYAEGNGALYAKYLRDRRLLRHFYWDLKGCLRELRGGLPMDPVLGLTFRANVLGCLAGMARYARTVRTL